MTISFSWMSIRNATIFGFSSVACSWGWTKGGATSSRFRASSFACVGSGATRVANAAPIMTVPRVITIVLALRANAIIGDVMSKAPAWCENSPRQQRQWFASRPQVDAGCTPLAANPVHAAERLVERWTCPDWLNLLAARLALGLGCGPRRFLHLRV